MDYYNSIAEGYNGLHMEEQLRKLMVILEGVSLSEGDMVLDVGSGTSFSLDHLNCMAVGVDPSFELLKMSKGFVINAIAENLPFLEACTPHFQGSWQPQSYSNTILFLGESNISPSGE